MGTTFFLANIAKRQYFDPSDAGGAENTKRSGILWGMSGHALAQLLLPDADLGFSLESWIGDPLVLVGDECDPNTIDLLKPFQDTLDQDSYHIVTEQFDNISLNLIAHLCKRREPFHHFLDVAVQDDGAFVNLAHTILYLGAKHIELGLIARFGADWRDRYHEILKAMPYHYPLPLTPESKGRRGPHVVRAADVLGHAKPKGHKH
jgi:hypothetical protein